MFAHLFVGAAVIAGMPLPTQDTSLQVVPGERAGPVRPSTTGADLVAALGANAVPAPVFIGEGFTEPGLVLFPDDPSRRAYVYWRDTVGLTEPARLLIIDAETRWQIPLGLTIGTTLEDLELLNGRPFRFGGLDWDYGGGVYDWDGGALDTVLGPGMVFRVGLLAHCAEKVGAAYGEIVGERTVESTHPVARGACVRIGQISVAFESP